MTQIEFPHVYINGIVYRIIDVEIGGTLVVERPNGIKTYRARRLPDHPLYGESRARIIWTEIPTDSDK